MIQYMVCAVVLTVLMGWLAKSRLKKRVEKTSGELFYPAGIFILGLIGFLFFVALVILSNVYSNNTTTWWTTACFAGFAAVCFFVILDYFRARHRFVGDGLHYGKLFGSGGFVTWVDIRQVRYAWTANWFVLKTQSGQTIRISSMLVGLPEFAQTVLANVPSNIIEPKTRPVLEATAGGKPPSIWL